MSEISLKVNGQMHAVDVDPETPLLFVLADELGLRGPKFGCGMAQCGACSVLLRGNVVRSCVMPVNAVGKDEVITLEGLGTPEKPHPLQQAFIEEGAAQCGFCLSGVILTAKAVLDENPKASDEQIREAMGSVLCRCFTHTRMRGKHELHSARFPENGWSADRDVQCDGLARASCDCPRSVRYASLACRSGETGFMDRRGR
jgi:nicotinate dehydrogenase subunit A